MNYDPFDPDGVFSKPPTNQPASFGSTNNAPKPPPKPAAKGNYDVDLSDFLSGGISTTSATNPTPTFGNNNNTTKTLPTVPPTNTTFSNTTDLFGNFNPNAPSTNQFPNAPSTNLFPSTPSTNFFPPSNPQPLQPDPRAMPSIASLLQPKPNSNTAPPTLPSYNPVSNTFTAIPTPVNPSTNPLKPTSISPTLASSSDPFDPNNNAWAAPFTAPAARPMPTFSFPPAVPSTPLPSNPSATITPIIKPVPVTPVPQPTPVPVAKPMPVLPAKPTPTAVSNPPPAVPVSVTGRTTPTPSNNTMTTIAPKTSGYASAVAAVTSTASQSLQAAYTKLEKGAFPEALHEVTQALKLLLTLKQDEVQSLKKEMKICVAYKYLLQLLIEIKQSEQNVSRAAFLTRILADIQSIQPKHRLTCVRMAINKNMEARNYKVAARFIQVLLPLKLMDQASLEQKLKTCQDFKLEDFQKVPYVCPSCQNSVDAGSVDCEKCGKRILFCHATFKPISQGFFNECNFCASVFSNDATSLQGKCPACQYGTLSVINQEDYSLPKSTPGSAANSPKESQFHALTMDSVGFHTGVATPIQGTPVTTPNSSPGTSRKRPVSMQIPSNFNPQNNNEHSSFVPPQKALPTPVPTSTPSPQLPPQKALPTPVPTSTPSPQLPPQKALPVPVPKVATNPTPAPAHPVHDPVIDHGFDPFEEDFTPKSATTLQPKFGAPATGVILPQNIKQPATPPELTLEKSRSGSSSSKSSGYESDSSIKTMSSSGSLLNFQQVVVTNPNVITPQQRQAYRVEFEAADPARTGKLSASAAKSLFKQSGLSNATLALIWRLADVDQDAKLDLEEFTIAMHYIASSLQGHELPGKLPKELIPFGKSKHAPPDAPLPAPPAQAPPRLLPVAPTPMPIAPESPGTLRRRSNTLNQSSLPSVQDKKEKEKDKKEKKEKEKKEKKEKEKKEKKDKKAGTVRGVPKELSKSTENPQGTLRLPPSISAPPVVSSPLVEPARPSEPVAPPPSLFTPPMLPNVIPSALAAPPPLVTPSMHTNPRELSRSPPPLPARAASPVPDPSPPASDNEAPPLPPREPNSRTNSATQLPKAAPPPIPHEEEEVPKEVTYPFQFYPVSMHGQPTPPSDYLAEVPAPVALAVNFVVSLISYRNYQACYDLMDTNIKQYLSFDQLAQLGDFYSSLPELWYCTATAFEQASFSVVFVPLYFATAHHQAKLWVNSSSIIGLEFLPLSEEDKWNEAGNKKKYVVATPKRVIKSDGTVKEVHSPVEEKEAMLDPKVPLGIQVGEGRHFIVRLQHSVEIKQKKPSLTREGKDGRSYVVFVELGVSDQTRAIHSDAYYKQFWVPKKDETHPLFYLYDKNGELLSEEPLLELNDGKIELQSAHRREKKKDKQDIAFKQLPSVEHFYVVSLIPPETSFQSVITNTIKQKPGGFLSVDRKASIITVASGEKKVVVGTEMDVLTRSAKLKPRYEGEYFMSDAQILSPMERRLASKTTSEIDYMDKNFQDWLGKTNLFTGIFGVKETAVEFAHRAFVTTVKDISYITPGPLKISETIKAMKGDKLSINKVFVGALRANGIPARVVYGRYAQSSVTPPQDKKSKEYIEGDQQYHVQSVFYVDNLGWVPCDPASCVKGSPEFEKNQTADKVTGGFGSTQGNFIGFSVDKPIVNIPNFGPSWDLNPQDLTLLFEYKKLATEWSVELLVDHQQ